MRIVSLVPSLTLTLFDLGLDAKSIVGRTPWCIHPSEHVGKVPVVGGTKTPNRSKIKAAQPDLVVMDRDENPKEIYDWCADEGIATSAVARREQMIALASGQDSVALLSGWRGRFIGCEFKRFCDDVLSHRSC